MIWTIPSLNNVKEFAKAINCDWIGIINVYPDCSCDENNCHNNVKNYISSHNGEQVLGYYFLESSWTFQAVLHSIWKDNSGKLIDITPFSDKRKFNVFAKLKNNQKLFQEPNVYSRSLNKYKKQETDIMFYVYALIDPITDLPFYIGKGKGRRARTHLWDIPETRNQYKENKIASIRNQGLEPKIEYFAENIIDEELAYKIESDLILKYGRKGYDEYGILTNICLDARPPNHKGKTYEEIYGAERAILEKKKRSELQKAKGGYGPKKHSEETRQKLKQKSQGENNGMFGRKHSKETIEKIKNNRKLKTGKDHYLSKCYILIDTLGKKYILYGGELKKFCNENNLSYATFRKTIDKKWPPSKRGKNQGWIIIEQKKEIIC